MPSRPTIILVAGLCTGALACSGAVDSSSDAGAGAAGSSAVAGTGATSGGRSGSGSGGATAGRAGASLGAGTGAGAGAGAAGSSGSGGRAGHAGSVAGAAAGASGRGNGGAGGASGTPSVEPDPLEGDFVIGPNPAADPDVNQRDVPHGKSFDLTMDSSKSAIFPGTTSTLNAENQHAFQRKVTVYVPKQYVDGDAAPFMVVADARDQAEIRNTLDNLIADKRLPTIIAIFIANGGGDSKGSERGLEYDTMSDAYARFVDSEVLPAVVSNNGIKAQYPKLKLTDDPEGRAAYGCSSGGSASLIQGWLAPDSFRKLVTYSGTFVDQQDDDAPTESEYPLGAWEFHSSKRLIETSPIKPLRIFLQCGENDLGSTAPEDGHHNWVMANQRTAAALKAKGYHYRFVFVKGAGHCDSAAIRATLPDTMEFMWRGYRP